MAHAEKPRIYASIVTQNLNRLERNTNNIYESIMVIAKRAKQIATKTKEELDIKLQDFASTTDSLSEVFENQEQIDISRFYERKPKSTLLAQEEFLNDELFYRRAQTDPEEPESI